MAETWVSMPDLATLIGEAHAKSLSKIRGGVPFYVPTQYSPDHELARLIGAGGLQMLCSVFGGRYITVPNGKKPESHKAEIMNLLEEGKSHAFIARELGITERYVRAIASHMPKARQLTLPM